MSQKYGLATSSDTEYTEDSYSKKCIFQLCNSGSLRRFFSFIHIWVVLALNYHILEEFGLGSEVKPTSPSGAVCEYFAMSFAKLHILPQFLASKTTGLLSGPSVGLVWSHDS